MRFPLIRHVRAIASKLEHCEGDAIDLDRTKELLSELEPILARIEVQTYWRK